MLARRVLRWLVGTLGALVGLVTAGGGWVYSGQLLPAPARDRTLDIRATVTGRGTVRLPADRRACLESFGLLLADGFLRYGGPVRGACDGQGTVERDILGIDRGDPARDVEVDARFDNYLWSEGPEQVGLTPQVVDVQTPVGPAEAWHLPGDGETRTWVIFVHGRPGTRGEALRILPAVNGAGHPCLVITYRNDFAGGPAGEDRLGRFGQAEWPDLSAAIDHALDQGAGDVVLYGFSQGGSLISYHVRERGTEHLSGIILDSPLLDLPETLVQQARLRGLPDPVIGPVLLGTRWLARWRGDGFDVADVDHVDVLARATDVPVLLFHGPQDDWVPVGASDRLAAARQQRLVYERWDAPGHVEAYNADAQRYTAAVLRFLDDLER